MIYELKNKVTGRVVTVNQDQLDILKAKGWLKRYEPPILVSGTNTETFVPEEIKRMKTGPKETISTAVPLNQQEIPGLPAKNKKD